MVEILICSPFVTFGGVERVILNRIHALAALELPFHFSVYFSADYGADDAFKAYLRDYALEGYCQRRQTLDGYRPDVALVIDAPETIPLVAADIPLIVECHAPYSENRMYLRSPQLAERMLELWVPSESFVATIAAEVPSLAGRIRVMPDFIPSMPIVLNHQSAAADSQGVVYLGRMDSLKNVTEAMRIADRTRDVFRYGLRFRGCGVLSDPAAKQFVSEHSHPEWLKLEPPIPFEDTMTWLSREAAARSVFISSSQGESFGMSVAEAMSAGLPVLLSDIPAHRELVTGDERFLYQPGDTDTAATKLDRLLGQDWDAASDWCRTRAVDFGPARFVTPWLEAMSRLAAADSPVREAAHEIPLTGQMVRDRVQYHAARCQVTLLSQRVVELESEAVEREHYLYTKEIYIAQLLDQAEDHARYKEDKERYIAMLLARMEMLRRWTLGVPDGIGFALKGYNRFRMLADEFGMRVAVRQALAAVWRLGRGGNIGTAGNLDTMLSCSSQPNPYRQLVQLKPIKVDVIDCAYSPSNARSMHFSCVTTVRNEADGIREFLDSVLDQSQQAEEVIVVDGGSSDGTQDVVRQAMLAAPGRITLIEAGAVNIAKGRNIGIDAAAHEIIVLVDAGCRLSPDFLANMIGPYQDYPDVDLISGIYHACEASDATSRFIYDWDGAMDWPSFLPSARAVCIRKTLWRDAGGFPEYLTLTGEDTLFDVQYRRRSRHWLVNKCAKVYWHAPTSEEAADKLAYRYGVGDGESGFGDFRHYPDLVNSQLQCDATGRSQHARGYLDGRRKRAEVEVERRRIAGLVLMLCMPSFAENSGTNRSRDTAIALANRGYKIIHAAVSGGFSRKRVFFDVDYSLIELYSLRDLAVAELLDRYAPYRELPVTVLLDSPHPGFVDILRLIRSRIGDRVTVIYDRSVDWRSKPGGGWYSEAIEQQLVSQSDSLTASSMELAEDMKAKFGRDVAVLQRPLDIVPSLGGAKNHGI